MLKSGITKCESIKILGLCSVNSLSDFSNLEDDSKQFKCYAKNDDECIVNYPCSSLKDSCLTHFDDNRCFMNGYD
jgi:hypothetical protein